VSGPAGPVELGIRRPCLRVRGTTGSCDREKGPGDSRSGPESSGSFIRNWDRRRKGREGAKGNGRYILLETWAKQKKLSRCWLKEGGWGAAKINTYGSDDGEGENWKNH